jgi:uncharacterized membrane protein YsdA (DUF1294 family)
MQNVNTFTESELVTLKGDMVKVLSTMRKQQVRKKFKIFGKTLLSVVLVAGGVAVAIVFPSPITVAVLGGAAALIGGQNGTISDMKNVRHESAKRRNGKVELKSLEGELVSRKTAREVMNTISQQQYQSPTAPPLYPELEY